jgi:hypothetical protein
LASIEKWPGDEILVIQHDPPSGNWGNSERQDGTDKAKCDYLAYIDDDDVYVSGHRKIMDDTIRENPGYPILFKMQYPSGRILWEKKWVKNGNIGCPMILVPNRKDMLYIWEPTRSMADFFFVNRWKWNAKEINWKDMVIAMVGHNDEKYEQKLNFREAKEKKIIL